MAWTPLDEPVSTLVCPEAQSVWPFVLLSFPHIHFFKFAFSFWGDRFYVFI